MGSDEAGRLLIYTYVEGQILFDPFPGEDLIELSASLQRRFPDQVVEPADPKWLRKATRESLPLPPSEEELAALLDEALAQEQPIYAPGDAGFPPEELHEYVYLVLGWLGGTVAKPAAEQVVQAATDLIGQWMRKRRSKKGGRLQIAYILGPDGKVLKRIEMPPESR
jgi:hypothetical protein